jgi:membrane carboxypeptidase/penicillin-binding protein
MKKAFKTVFIAIAAVVLLLIIYCSIIVVKARIDTPGIMKKALSAENIKIEPSDMSKWQKDALLKVEDPGFYSHHGVDLKTPGQGITTITQGLVKIFYFKNFKPGFAKLKQTLIARFVMDGMVSKQDQLRLFINYVYLGKCKDKPVYGFADAARCYYNRALKKLTEGEYLSIVAMMIAPKNFGIETNPIANKERVSRIKKVISGEYVPKGLMDVYYGPLDTETQKGLAPASYFKDVYKK